MNKNQKPAAYFKPTASLAQCMDQVTEDPSLTEHERKMLVLKIAGMQLAESPRREDRALRHAWEMKALSYAPNMSELGRRIFSELAVPRNHPISALFRPASIDPPHLTFPQKHNDKRTGALYKSR